MSDDFDEWYSKYSAFVLPVCFIGLAAAVHSGSGEAWWGWLFVVGLVVWFVVIPFHRRP